MPNCSEHDGAHDPATHWQALKDPQADVDVVEQSVLHCCEAAFQPHSGLLPHIEALVPTFEQDCWQVLLANWQAPFAPQLTRALISEHDIPQRPLRGSHVHSTSPSQLADTWYLAEHFCWQTTPEIWQVGSFKQFAVVRSAHEATHLLLVAA